MSQQEAKEILTLQFGEFSNSVGSHFWNLQDVQLTDAEDPELNPRILTRRGITERGRATVTPRLVACDGKGRLGTLRQAGYLYHQQTLNAPERASEQAAWSGTIQHHVEPALPRNDFLNQLHDQAANTTSASYPPVLNFDATTTTAIVWTDYLQAHLHPKSIVEVPEYQLSDPFHLFYAGSSQVGPTVVKATTEETWERLRFFLEECDRLQGIHCLVDVDSGWGGYSMDILHELRQECRSATLLSLGLDHPYPTAQTILSDEESLAPSGKRESRRQLNLALATASLAEVSSLYVPIHCPVDVSTYHASASIAAALETLSSSYRRTTTANAGGAVMGEMTSLVSLGRPEMNVAALACGFPFSGISTDKATSALPTVAQHLVRTGQSFFPSSVPVSNTSTSLPVPLAEWLTVRGFGSSSSLAPGVVGPSSWQSRSHTLTWLHAASDPTSRTRHSTTPCHLSEIEAMLPIPPSFPTPRGGEHDVSQGWGLTALSSLSTSSAVPSYLSSLVDHLATMDVRVVQEYTRAGMEVDTVADLRSKLMQRAESYV